MLGCWDLGPYSGTNLTALVTLLNTGRISNYISMSYLPSPRKIKLIRSCSSHRSWFIAIIPINSPLHIDIFIRFYWVDSSVINVTNSTSLSNYNVLNSSIILFLAFSLYKSKSIK